MPFRQNKIKAGLITLTLYCATACMHTGQNFPSRTDWVKIDQTKQSDVRMVLGNPFAVGNSGGVPTWTYAFFEYGLFQDAHNKELKFYWNDNQTVKHYSFTSSFPSDTNAAVGIPPGAPKNPELQGY